MRTERADVVVLGGGAAGLSAALAAAEDGVSVAVVSKVYPMRSHTVAAEGGAAGVHRASDSFGLHEADTMRAGAGLAEPDAVKYVVAQAPVELARLERLGMPFSRDDDGDVSTRKFGGMSEPRTWFAADKTGFHLLHTLYQTALQYPNIRWFNEYFALDLKLPVPFSDSAPPGTGAPNPQITGGGNNGAENQIGLLTYSQADGEPVTFVTRALIIATGGFARAWRTSTNAAIVTGDGLALALRAGLPLRDMEFVQWHPTCLPGTGFLITEAARGEGGVLLDKDGKRYLADYGLGPVTAVGHPEPRKMELGPRDALSNAFAQAVKDGRTRKLEYPLLSSGTREIDVVDLDLTHLGAEVLKAKLPLVLDLARRYARVDATKQPIPICPAAHYTMGGIPTNTQAQVLDAAGNAVPGLFAAGECASTGLHGANRLGSNSLVETLVMGRTAGTKAASTSVELDSLRDFQGWAERSWQRFAAMKGEGSENHYQMQAELGELLDQHFGIQLTNGGLAALASGIAYLQQRYSQVQVTDTAEKYNSDWQQATELGFMLDCAQAAVAAARTRHESRGAFQNLDYPNTGPTAQHSLITN